MEAPLTAFSRSSTRRAASCPVSFAHIVHRRLPPARPNNRLAPGCSFRRFRKFDWLGVFSYSDEGAQEPTRTASTSPQAHDRIRRRKQSEASAKISTRAQRTGSAARLDLLRRRRVRRDRTPCGRVARSITLLRSTARFIINDFGPHEELRPGTHTARITESHDYDVVATELSKVSFLKGFMLTHLQGYTNFGALYLITLERCGSSRHSPSPPYCRVVGLRSARILPMLSPGAKFSITFIGSRNACLLAFYIIFPLVLSVLPSLGRFFFFFFFFFFFPTHIQIRPLCAGDGSRIALTD